MSRHKWGILWLVLLTWNAANFGLDIASDNPWYALAAGLTAGFSAVMAYRDLTKPGPLTITITPDTRAFDAAMKRAMRTKP